MASEISGAAIRASREALTSSSAGSGGGTISFQSGAFQSSTHGASSIVWLIRYTRHIRRRC